LVSRLNYETNNDKNFRKIVKEYQNLISRSSVGQPSTKSNPNASPSPSPKPSSGVGWVERNNTGAKMAQFAGKSATQPPQRLLLVGFPCVNPTYNRPPAKIGTDYVQ
jgi:hypothetical protein